MILPLPPLPIGLVPVTLPPTVRLNIIPRVALPETEKAVPVTLTKTLEELDTGVIFTALHAST